MRELIGAVREGADAICAGSGEIAVASEDLARRTEGNAASLEQTSAAIIQMDNRLRATAQSAVQTVEIADQAIAAVLGGRTVTDDAVQAMGRVSESARGIDSVIEGLDKIAFQTRVLAMNAAVEARRAGEAGRASRWSPIWFRYWRCEPRRRRRLRASSSSQLDGSLDATECRDGRASFGRVADAAR